MSSNVSCSTLQRVALPFTLGRSKIPGIKIYDTRLIRLMKVLLHGEVPITVWRIAVQEVPQEVPGENFVNYLSQEVPGEKLCELSFRRSQEDSSQSIHLAPFCRFTKYSPGTVLAPFC